MRKCWLRICERKFSGTKFSNSGQYVKSCITIPKENLITLLHFSLGIGMSCGLFHILDIISNFQK